MHYTHQFVEIRVGFFGVSSPIKALSTVVEHCVHGFATLLSQKSQTMLVEFDEWQNMFLQDVHFWRKALTRKCCAVVQHEVAYVFI